MLSFTQVLTADEFMKLDFSTQPDIDYEQLANMLNKFSERTLGKPKDVVICTADDLKNWHPLLVNQLRQRLLERLSEEQAKEQAKK